MTPQEIRTTLIHDKFNTKYLDWYLGIIENAKSKNRKKVKTSDPDYTLYHAHHILPKAMFPDFGKINIYKWNCILLTPKEHFTAHKCLHRHYKKIQHSIGIYKSLQGVLAFTMFKRNTISSREYSKLVTEKSIIFGTIDPITGMTEGQRRSRLAAKNLSVVDPKTKLTGIELKENKRRKSIEVVDVKTGLSPKQLATQNSLITRSKVDPKTGLTTFQMSSNKASETKKKSKYWSRLNLKTFETEKRLKTENIWYFIGASFNKNMTLKFYKFKNRIYNSLELMCAHKNINILDVNSKFLKTENIILRIHPIDIHKNFDNFQKQLITE